mgnify:CR=1 FL=1
MSYTLKIAKKNTKTTKNSPMLYIMAILLFIVTLIPQNISQIRFAENVIYKYSTIFIVFELSFVILLLGYLKKKKQKGFVEIKEVNNEG